MMHREVTIYTLPTCPFCVMAKEYLREKGIGFEEKDIQQDLEAREELLEASGQLGVPVFTIDEDIVVGFNQTQLESLLVEN